MIFLMVLVGCNLESASSDILSGITSGAILLCLREGAQIFFSSNLLLRGGGGSLLGSL